MDKYKLGNLTKKHLLEAFDNKDIHKHKFSFSLLNSLCKKYKVQECLINYYDLYGEDYCCWQENLISLGNNLNKENTNQYIYKELKHYFNKYVSNIGQRKIFMTESEKFIVYIIPLRDVELIDIIISFDKTISPQ